MAYFEELSIWQQAKELTKEIYEMMQNSRDWGLRDQIQRASVSIMNNIAEGSESGSAQSYIRFLNIAKEVVQKYAACFISVENLDIAAWNSNNGCSIYAE